MHPNVHAALLTIAKTWKLPKCPLTEEWIYTSGILLSNKKIQWNNAICGNMDGSEGCHTEWSKTEKHKHRISLICEKRKETNELIYRNRLTDIENKLMVTEGEVKGSGG